MIRVEWSPCKGSPSTGWSVGHLCPLPEPLCTLMSSNRSSCRHNLRAGPLEWDNVEIMEKLWDQAGSWAPGIHPVPQPSLLQQLRKGTGSGMRPGAVPGG